MGEGVDQSREQSRVRDGSELPHGNASQSQITSNGDHATNGKPSRPRYMHPQRTSMNEMKRRVAAILEFISRTQLEMASAAGDDTPPAGGKVNETATATMLRSIAETLPDHPADGSVEQASKERPFAELSSLEMMDVLTRRLVLWQKEFGKWGDK